MSLEAYQNSAIAQADSVLDAHGRKTSISSTMSQSSQDPPRDLRRMYQETLFQHTNRQYLKAKQRLAKQSLRRSRDVVRDCMTSGTNAGTAIGHANIGIEDKMAALTHADSASSRESC